MSAPHAEQLGWETRAARPAAVAAGVAAACLIGATVYLQASIGERADGTDELLKLVDANASDFIVSGVIQGIGLLLLAPALGYLYRATRYRRPAMPRVAIILLVAGAVTAAVLGVVRQAEFVSVAADFVDAGPPTGPDAEQRAEDLIDDSSLPVVSGIGFAANLALGFSVVLLSLNAMRAGLTSRFLGIIGIIIGVLYVLPVAGGPQIVQLFWLGALAVLFLGRWPGGRGPAWEAGEAIPWPSAADQARELQREQEKTEGQPQNGRGAGRAPESADPDVPRPASRKRKKRRGR